VLRPGPVVLREYLRVYRAGQGIWDTGLCDRINVFSDDFTLCFQYRIIKCMKILEHTTQLVSAAGMFSNNETIEEIPTADVKYMLLPFMLGSLALKLTNNGNRLDVVKTAEVYFRDYLQRYVSKVCLIVLMF